MDMPKNMKEWCLYMDFLQEKGTAQVIKVEVVFWRAMCEKNIDIFRNGPFSRVWPNARILECPVPVLWSPRAPVYF
jgi:hypothetical protein